MRDDSKPLHECKCRICGKVFYAKNKRQVLCSSECRRIAGVEGTRLYRQRHKAVVNERQRLKRKRLKDKASQKTDTLVAVGYAERQKAKSLEKAGKVNTEL